MHPQDLRLDERVMQLFGLVNALLQSDPVSTKMNLSITRYAVIPLSANAGIIGWVENCDTFHQLVCAVFRGALDAFPLVMGWRSGHQTFCPLKKTRPTAVDKLTTGAPQPRTAIGWPTVAVGKPKRLLPPLPQLPTGGSARSLPSK